MFGSFSFLWAGDRSPSPVRQWMSQTPEEVVPLVQKDDFSCGYLALAAIYQSYGLDPELARLRERLGTSVPAIPFVNSTTGTLQPDLVRVLKQDGFQSLAINPEDDHGQIRRHLSGPHLALALVTTERAGGFHWIVLTDYQDGSYEVADSLVRGLQRKSEEEILGPHFRQALLLSPGIPDRNGPLAGVHYRGSLLLFDSLPPGAKVSFVLILLGMLVLTSLVVRWLLRGFVRIWRKRKAV